MRNLLFFSSMLALGSACADDPPPCDDRESLQARLDGASAGDTVALGACTVTGPITVPSSVRLEGAGALATTIVAPPGARGITLAPGAELAQLTVQTDGCAGIVALGAGSVTIEDVEVRASRGVGIAIEGATDAALRRVEVRGTIDEATADTTPPPLPPFSCGSSVLPTHGIVLVSVGSATLEDVGAEGFGAFGVVSVRSSLAWIGGGVGVGLGAGLEIWDGDAQIEDVSITGLRYGAGPVEAFGGVIAGGAEVTTRGLVVDDNQGFGLFHDGSSAVHEGLSANGNGFAAVWAQSMTAFEVTGASSFADNAFAAVAVLGSTGVIVRDSVIASTTEGVRVDGARTVRAADGLQLVGTDATIRAVELNGNERVGALVDLEGGTTASLALMDVTVDGTGAGLGVIAQNGTLAVGWDDGVTRLGDTVANDAMFSGRLEVADAVGPPCFPPAEALTTGLMSLVGP